MPLDQSIYSKTKSPIYTPKGPKPELSKLVNVKKVKELVKEIKESELPDDEKEFLIQAAQRHAIYHFKNIAEYYAHATPAMQRLMEKSALVIIDFDKAIEYGYVKISERVARKYNEDHVNEES
jgi:hypothetical protein